jgi:hypothetical protein
MLLGAAFVPSDKAHHFRWWAPKREGRPWYYWTRRNPREEIGSLEVDPEELDSSVRPIVTWCLDRGWRTTPSCEGHFPGTSPEDDLKEAMSLLAQDGRKIRRGELILTDSETGDDIKPRIPNWVGPDPEETYKEIKNNNGRGCIGFVPLQKKDWTSLQRRNKVFVQEEGPLVLISTRASSPKEVEDLWGGVFEDLQRLCSRNLKNR